MERTFVKTILDLCGGTGSWSKPYAYGKYEVLIVDPFSEVEGAILEDVRTWVPPKDLEVHGILAAPPCTHLAVSGARWWKDKGESALQEALSIVDACLRLVARYEPEWWALENPVGRLTSYLGKPRWTFQPWEFGDPWPKRTCLWGNFNIPEKGPIVTPDPTKGPWYLPPSPDRAKLRSVTPNGFVEAFFRANP